MLSFLDLIESLSPFVLQTFTAVEAPWFSLYLHFPPKPKGLPEENVCMEVRLLQTFRFSLFCVQT